MRDSIKSPRRDASANATHLTASRGEGGTSPRTRANDDASQSYSRHGLSCIATGRGGHA